MKTWWLTGAPRVRYRLSVRGARILTRELARLVAAFAVYVVLLAGLWLAFTAFVQYVPLQAMIRSALVPTVELTVGELDGERKFEIERGKRENDIDLVTSYIAQCLQGESTPLTAEMQTLVEAARALYDELADTGYAPSLQYDSHDAAYTAALAALRDAMETDRDLLDRVAPEAIEATAGDEAYVGVYSWSEGLGVTYTAYHDGHVVREDATFYNLLGYALRICAVAVVVGGPVLIIAWSLRRALVRYDALHEMVQAVHDGHELPSELPESLQEDRALVEGVRVGQEHREQAARAAEARKNELVAYLAHDIKTPLTAVTGYLALLNEAPDIPAAQRQRYIASALAKTRRLDGMLDEFFDITRFNIAALEIERSRFDLATFCEQVADELEPQAAARGVAIAVSAPEEVSAAADADKLFRALENIVRNAVAYADPGSTVDIVADTAEDGSFSIAVTDRGREIAPGHLERIFEKFYREDPARPTEQGGAGLGLAIAREIARAHGGDITVSSENGITVFTLTVPQPEAVAC